MTHFTIIRILINFLYEFSRFYTGGKTKKQVVDYNFQVKKE